MFPVKVESPVTVRLLRSADPSKDPENDPDPIPVNTPVEDPWNEPEKDPEYPDTASEAKVFPIYW